MEEFWHVWQVIQKRSEYSWSKRQQKHNSWPMIQSTHCSSESVLFTHDDLDFFKEICSFVLFWKMLNFILKKVLVKHIEVVLNPTTLFIQKERGVFLFESNNISSSSGNSSSSSSFFTSLTWFYQIFARSFKAQIKADLIQAAK